MASTARRSVVGPRHQEERKDLPDGTDPGERIETYGRDNEDDSAERNAIQKRVVQMQYLEQENQNLQLENDDLNTTLKINKNIIKEILQSNGKYDQQFEYAMAQVTQENELWETRVKSLTEQRDRLVAE